MGTHEENMKDPAWLAMQIERYKGELAAVTEQRDAAREQCSALRIQLDAASARASSAEARLPEIDQLRSQIAQTNATLSRTQAERDNAMTLANKRRAALASVITVAGKVLEVAAPLVDEA